MAARKKTKLKVKDKPNLVRDSFSKAIINVDRNAYAAAQARKRNIKQRDKKMADLEAELSALRAEQIELLALVKTLVKKS